MVGKNSRKDSEICMIQNNFLYYLFFITYLYRTTIESEILKQAINDDLHTRPTNRIKYLNLSLSPLDRARGDLASLASLASLRILKDVMMHSRFSLVLIFNRFLVNSSNSAAFPRKQKEEHKSLCIS